MEKKEKIGTKGWLLIALAVIIIAAALGDKGQKEGGGAPEFLKPVPVGMLQSGTVAADQAMIDAQWRWLESAYKISHLNYEDQKYMWENWRTLEQACPGFNREGVVNEMQFVQFINQLNGGRAWVFDVSNLTGIKGYRCFFVTDGKTVRVNKKPCQEICLDKNLPPGETDELMLKAVPDGMEMIFPAYDIEAARKADGVN